ncbi:MAG: hypothetical protein M3R71_02795 [Actinomycetota bacterium]|nr:hypothetical protein [Actinomycetota bacterium]
MSWWWLVPLAMGGAAVGLAGAGSHLLRRQADSFTEVAAALDALGAAYRDAGRRASHVAQPQGPAPG